MIEEKSERRLQLRMMLVNIERISDETSRNLELTVAELNDSIALLKTQKELSAENEGWVMNAIHGYHQGFVQGLNDYVAGENLLNSIKNI
jgi:predicted alpha/beta hydrolase family esterase